MVNIKRKLSHSALKWKQWEVLPLAKRMGPFFNFLSAHPDHIYDLIPKGALGKKYQFLNFGYWSYTLNYDNAAKNLALKLAEFSNVNMDQVLLSVGCGFGDEVNLWQNTYQLKHTIGLNIYWKHLLHCQQNFGSEDIIFYQADATCIPFRQNSFDRVLSLESAFHFKTREQFFNQAYTVLKPQGILGLADIILHDKITIFQKLRLRIICRIMKIPKFNQYAWGTYEEKLKKAGFQGIEYKDISSKVLKGFGLHLTRLYKSKRRSFVVKAFFYFFGRKLPISYILVKAVKP